MALGNLLVAAGFTIKSIRLLYHRLPPKTALMHRLLPAALFRLSCQVWGRISREKQLLLKAEK